MVVAPHSLNFGKVALAAFPIEHRVAAGRAAEALLPFVDPSYRKAHFKMVVSGRSVSVPSRVHYGALDLASLGIAGEAWLAANCLCTRSTDGYMRHAALRNIVGCRHPTVIPFVVMLAGEYVLEIIDDIVAAMPTMDRAAYANFVLENRPTMERLRSKATSYWNEYYRAVHTKSSTYPGLLFLHEIERWAS